MAEPRYEDREIVGLEFKERYRNVEEYMAAFNENDFDNEDDHPAAPPHLAELAISITSFGVTIEFAMATTPGRNTKKDPHPGETRWLPWFFSRCDFHPLGTRYLDPSLESVWALTVRDHILDTFKLRALNCYKHSDPSLYPLHDITTENQFYDEEMMGILEGAEYKSWSKAFLRSNTYVPIAYDHSLPIHTNIQNTCVRFIRAYMVHHRDAYLHPNRMLYSQFHQVVEELRSNPAKLGPNWPPLILDLFCDFVVRWFRAAPTEVQEVIDRWITNIHQNDYYPVHGMKFEHAFHTVGGSDEMLVEFMNDGDYGPEPSDEGIKSYNRVRQYKWFKGKIRMPIQRIDFPHWKTNLRRVCRYMRKTYRIHKPMSSLGGRVCVHIGCNMGWSLLELKKFATVWILLESRVTRFFRRDQCSEFQNRPIASFSRLGRYNLEVKTRELVPDYDFDFEAVGELEWFRYRGFAEWRRQDLQSHVPDIFPATSHIPRLLDDLWQYPSINMLREGLMDIQQPSNMDVHFNVRGYKRTDEGPGPGFDETESNTVDFRMMHSNLQNNYIQDWVAFLNALANFARWAQPGVFQQRLKDLWTSQGNVYTRIGRAFGVQDEVERLAFQNRPTGEEFLRYPDNDAVDWTQPFMTASTNSMYKEDPGVNPDPFDPDLPEPPEIDSENE